MTLERENDIRIGDEESIDQLSEADAAEAAEIRTDIEVTRVEMGATLNQLGDRLEPSHLVDQAKENVREATIGRVEETARGMSDMVMETIKSNPIPAAMAGAGLALLWANRSSGNSGGRSGSNGSHGGSSYGRHEEQGIGDRVGQGAGVIGDRVSGAAVQVGETMGDVGETIGQRASAVGTQLDRVMQASPLAMGAIALGAGAVIGALVPETPQERGFMGDASRQLGSTVREAVDQAADQAETAMDQAEEKVGTGSSR